MFKNILVALDGSECSHQALDIAVTLAKEQGARCTVCTVVGIVRAASAMTFATWNILNQWIATLQQDARQIEGQAIAKYAVSGVNIESMVVEGYPSAAIIDVAEKKCADLIVMGSRAIGT